MIANYQAKDRYKGEIARNYLNNRTHEIKWQREQDIIKESVRKYMVSGGSVLDVPFGTGRFAQYYFEHGLKVYGLDISEDMLSEASKNIGDNLTDVELIVGDAENIPLSDKSVNYVVCVRLLNWVPLEVFEKCFDEFYRVASKLIIIHVRTYETEGNFRRLLNMVTRKPVYLIKSSLKVALKSVYNSFRKSEKEKGFIIHEKETVLRIFEKYNLNIREKIVVDESDSNLAYIKSPLCFYVLTKK